MTSFDIVCSKSTSGTCNYYFCLNIFFFIVVIRDELLQYAKQMKAFALGPFNPSNNVFHWLKCILPKYLPSDAHRLANGRLAVAMTHLTDGKHIVMSQFQSKEDVVQVRLHYMSIPY